MTTREKSTIENTEPNYRVALVTGASRGIGRAICLKLAQSPCHIAINYAHSAEEAQETVELCREVAQAAGHKDAQFAAIKGDVSETEGCEQLFEQTRVALGAPDILVNNAGITRDNLVLLMSIEDFDAVINANLRSAFILSKLAMRAMAKKRFGRIINISSVVGIAGNAGQANYAASKAGLIGLTKTLAKELGSRFVTANAVAPGFIQTRMTEELSEAVQAEFVSSLSIPRLGTPEDVAALVGFLASDEASYLTGQVISVDGGMAL